MTPKLSIITAIHNSLAMNQLYWKALSAHTTSPFELILIDNHSTDGSEIFFSDLAAKDPDRVRYIRNKRNQGYPRSQIQGMQAARADILCFLNNDIWVPKGWNESFERKLCENQWYVLSPSGQEAQPRQSYSDKLKKQWKRTVWLSKLWKTFTFRTEEERLWKALRWMYGDLEHFHSPTPLEQPFPGIKGDCVIFHRQLLKILPKPWDENVEAADWHLYLQLAKFHERDAFVPLPQVLPEVYVHHFGRYSARQSVESHDTQFRRIEDLYSADEIKRLWWGFRLPA